MTAWSSYTHLWSVCDYFLAHQAEGFHLSAFDRIHGESRKAGIEERYLFEKITRKVLAASSKGIKRFARDAVVRDKAGGIEKTARHLEQGLQQNLFQIIKKTLDLKLIRDLLAETRKSDDRGILLTLGSLYYGFHRNRHLEGCHIPPCYFRVFSPLLVTAHNGGHNQVLAWETELAKQFAGHVKTDDPFDLAGFFETKAVRQIISLALAGILAFLQQEEERAAYLLEVVNDLSQDQIKTFKRLVANGFYVLADKDKRFRPQNPSQANSRRGIPVVSGIHLEEIINQGVAACFDRALAEIIDYFQSEAEGRPKPIHAKNFDRIFVEMNQMIWKETLKMVDVQRRVLYRNKYVLRALIHYLFEAKGIEREFWKKYIPSVEKILRFSFRDDPDGFWRLSRRMGQTLETYRHAENFDGTDWEGFYNDHQTRAQALGVIREILQKARAPFDRKLPQAWFSSQVEKGVDDVVLLRFFSTAVGSD